MGNTKLNRVPINIEMTTPSKIIDGYFPFDRDTVSESVATRRSITKAEVLAEWDKKRTLGDECHAVVQKLLHSYDSDSAGFLKVCDAFEGFYSKNLKINHVMDAIEKNKAVFGWLVDEMPSDKHFIMKQLCHFIKEYLKGWTLVGTEIAYVSGKLKGVVDAVFVDELGDFMICELKFGSKLWMKSFDGQKGLGHMKQFDNCKYNKANLQLSIYSELLRAINRKVSHRYMIHFPVDCGVPTVLKPSNKMQEAVSRLWSTFQQNTWESELQSLQDTEVATVPTVAKQSLEILCDDSQDLQGNEKRDESDIKTPTLNSTTAAKKPRTRDVMIDIETLSTLPNAHILTIAGIKFTRDAKTVKLEEMDTFYRRISFESNDQLKRHKSSSTIVWWMGQGKEATKEAFAPRDRIPMKETLEDLADWLRNTKYVWSHGAAFDPVIVEDAMRQCGVKIPYKFWDVRDTRTAYDLAGIKLKDYQKKQNVHHALHDCYHQIEALRKAF